MPVKKLPPGLVKRLQRAGKKLDQNLKYMRIADWRALYHLNHRQDTHNPGGRVRHFDVKRNYPKVKGIILKRVHVRPAQEEIDAIKEKVRVHNEKYGDREYILVEPQAYAVDREIVAMAHTDSKDLESIYNGSPIADAERYGFLRKFCKSKLRENQEKEIKELDAELHKMAWRVCTRTGIRNTNIHVIGYHRKRGESKGKFVFVPLIDLN